MPLPYKCDFEVDMCSIEQLKDDRFDWTRFSGSTPTANTGPTQAFEGNWYIYTEVSGLLAGDYARYNIIRSLWISLDLSLPLFVYPSSCLFLIIHLSICLSIYLRGNPSVYLLHIKFLSFG